MGEEDAAPGPVYAYEGPRATGEEVEIAVSIPQEEGEPKTRTKKVALLGARKGEGGKASYPNGDAYAGAYFDGLRHGSGSYTYAAQPPAEEGEEAKPPAGVYEGVFKKGEKSGVGVMKYNDGGKYHGAWANGVRSGEGAMYYANGDIYLGGWAKGKKEGQGTYTHTATGARTAGTWADGKLVEGTFTDAFGNAYTGTFTATGGYGEGSWAMAAAPPPKPTKLDVIDRYVTTAWTGAWEADAAEGATFTHGGQEMPIGAFLGWCSAVGAAGCFPDWKWTNYFVEEQADGRVKVGSQQSTGKLAADIPAIGPFPEVKLSEVPADSLLLTDAGAILPIEVGYYTFDADLKVTKIEYDGTLDEQVEGVNTLESTPKVGPPLLYALAGKDLSPPPPAEAEGEAPAEPAE